jgi:ACT domain-containing protein
VREFGAEDLVLSLFRKHPQLHDIEFIKMSGLSRGTLYKYKKILEHRADLR